MIVKLQRPLMTSENPALVLVYDESRAFYAHMPYTSDIAALFKGAELKVYHKAKLRRGRLLIGKRVREQDW